MINHIFFNNNNIIIIIIREIKISQIIILITV